MKRFLFAMALVLSASDAIAEKYDIKLTNTSHIFCTNKDMADMLEPVIRRASTPLDFYVGMSDQGVIEIQNRVNHTNIKIQPNVGCALVDLPDRLAY